MTATAHDTTSHSDSVLLADDAPQHRDLPRRLARRIGPVHLHTPGGLFVMDLVACAVTWAVVGGGGVSFPLQAVLTLLAFAAAHLYRQRLSLSLLDDIPYIAGSVVLAQLALTAANAGHLTDRDLLDQARVAGIFFVALAVSRLVGFHLAKRMRCRGTTQDLALIIGAGHVGIQLARNFQEHSEFGVTPIGYIDSDPRVASHDELPAPLLGGYDELADVIDDFNVTYVVVAFGALRESSLVDILRTCDRMDVEVFFVPRLFELHNSNRDTDDVWGIPLLRVRRAAFRSPMWQVKRLIDITVAGSALLALSPVLALCAAAVRYEGGPGIIFRQERVGLDGRPFQVLKFRSLKPVSTDESQTQWNIKHDARLGPVGRFLRTSSLDELPQLWNIVRGDMSLVGPRPERPHFVEQFATHIPRYTARHRVPAGLTGWSQAHGLRGDTSIEDRARFDNYYIENWSPWLDIKIVLKTVDQVVRARGG